MSRRSRDRGWPPAPEPLPAAVVDNHTHLDAVLDTTDAHGWRERSHGARVEADDDAPVGAAPGPDPDVADHLARAAAAGVTRMVQIGCDLPGIAWTDRAVRRHPELLGGLAVHPNEAVLHAGVREVAPDGLTPQPREHHGVPLDEAIARVADLARANDRIRVIGETGLDHFRAGEQGRAVQREAFRAHVALAKELDLVLQIHDRDAHREVVEVLLADGAPRRTVFHCYSGDEAMARVCAEHGWYLSFAGPVTYPSSSALRAALHLTGPDRLLLESDAPYLPPHPLRGRPNAPYLVGVTARRVADELDLDLADLCRRVSATSEELYGPW
ncbi:MAG TPA: TatD family hydrolase [Actinotalea sp.]|nr:TatD family hydrolase [Actinotalea sp.]